MHRLSEQEYKDRQADRLRKMVKRQDAVMKDKVDGTSFGWSTAWEKKESVSYQQRPDRDIHKEQVIALAKIAKAGHVSMDDHMKDVTNVMRKQDTVQQEYRPASVSPVVSVQGRQVSSRSVDRDQMSEMHVAISNPEYDEMVSKMKHDDKVSATHQQERRSKVRDFLQPDDWHLFSRFIIVREYEDYVRSVRNKIKVSEITGVYLIANITKAKMYVGASSKAVEKCGQHFRRRIGSVDSVPEIREDMLLDDVMAVNFVRLKDTDFDSVEDLARYYIKKYDCRKPKGYNKPIVAV